MTQPTPPTMQTTSPIIPTAPTAAGPDIAALQDAIRGEGLDGWLLYDFRRSNAVAHRVLGLSPHAFFTRRWMYYIPATGEPTALTSAVESHVLAALPGRKLVYHTWQEYRDQLKAMLAKDGQAKRVAAKRVAAKRVAAKRVAAKLVAMEYVPENAIPYVSLVDAGTVELVRALGVEVAPSANFVQRFEAVLTPEQIESHRTAGKALMRAYERLLPWLRAQLEAGAALTEYDVQREFARLMTDEGLEVEADEKPLVAVNANAGNPHYSPTRERSSLVRPGDLLLLDFSARMPGAHSIFADYTWMVSLGEQVPDRIRDLFAIIRQARDAGVELLRERFAAGQRVEGYEVDDAVRGVIARAGYGDAFIHRTGHNIGTRVHGNGAHLDNFETHDTRPLLPNTITSVEPGIYLPEQGLGLRTEVDVILLPGGIEVTGVPAQAEVTALLA